MEEFNSGNIGKYDTLARRVLDALGGNGGEIQIGSHRLWPYGEATGFIPTERIRRPVKVSGEKASETIRKQAERIAGQGFPLRFCRVQTLRRLEQIFMQPWEEITDAAAEANYIIARRIFDALGETATGIRRARHRLWPYGDASGFIPIERIRRPVQVSGEKASETIRKQAERIAGQGFPLRFCRVQNHTPARTNLHAAGLLLSPSVGRSPVSRGLWAF